LSCLDDSLLIEMHAALFVHSSGVSVELLLLEIMQTRNLIPQGNWRDFRRVCCGFDAWSFCINVFAVCEINLALDTAAQGMF